MFTRTLRIRIANSIEAIGICWLISGFAFGLRLRDPAAGFIFFLWSLPFFAFGWIVAGIPIIAMGNRILTVPKIFLAIAGAFAGVFVMLLPIFVVSVMSKENVAFGEWKWSDETSLTTFGAGIGASTTILYSWLQTRALKRNKPELKN